MWAGRQGCADSKPGQFREHPFIMHMGHVMDALPRADCPRNSKLCLPQMFGRTLTTRIGKASHRAKGGVGTGKSSWMPAREIISFHSNERDSAVCQENRFVLD